jgi:hypothetical protein
MAGVPFEAVERLGTAATAEAARAVIAAATNFVDAQRSAEQLLRDSADSLGADISRTWRRAVRAGQLPDASVEDVPDAFRPYAEAINRLRSAQSRLEETLQIDLMHARVALLESARAVLPPYLVFGSGEVHQLLSELGPIDVHTLSPRNSRTSQRERPLLLYLQRVAAKNDTFSSFGPSSWGVIKSQSRGVTFSKQFAITKRSPFVERWAAHAATAAMNGDPRTRSEIAPRINPNGSVVGDTFVFAETGEVLSLDLAELETLARCDGHSPARSLGVTPAHLEELARRNVIHWQLETPALKANAFQLLVNDVEQWPDGDVKNEWLQALKPVEETMTRFAAAADTADRLQLMNTARQQLAELGVERKQANRSLYSAQNVIGEECFRDTGFEIDEALADAFIADAAPWIDFWRDSYAFVAHRVAAGLRKFLSTAPTRNSVVSLPAFLKHCEEQKMPLTRHGLVALAHVAFQEVKETLRRQLADREDAAEWQLDANDCHCIRNNFEFPKFDEYTFPSADLQISAASAEAVARGEYEWIIAELHPPLALLQNCFYWSCPDPGALSEILRSTVFGKPSFHFGFFAADFTAHTAVRIFDALPDLTNFVAPQRGDPNWRSWAPADVEVFVDETGDVGLRVSKTQEYLGSFARAWLIPLGFHPFQFGGAPQMPRLRCGRVIVQRAAWTVAVEELGAGDFTGVSRDLVVAVEKLRLRRGLPRFVYIRPTEQALRRSGAEGRDKDTKPVFIDLESYLFLEVFQKWLKKAGELEVTEMLPDPDHLLWNDDDGRRTFELRTQIVPRL